MDESQNDKGVAGSGPESRSGRPSAAAKRSSTALPKPPTSLHSSAIIANHAVLTGTYSISIGANTVIHPHAKIVSTYCPVEIGSGCIISEKAVIGLSDFSQDLGDMTRLPDKIVVHDHVKVESSALVEAVEVGEGSTVDVDAKLGAGARVGKHCTISASSVVAAGVDIPDYTVLYGDNQRRRNTTMLDAPIVGEIQAKGLEKQLKILQRLVPSNIAKWQ